LLEPRRWRIPRGTEKLGTNLSFVTEAAGARDDQGALREHPPDTGDDSERDLLWDKDGVQCGSGAHSPRDRTNGAWPLRQGNEKTVARGVRCSRTLRRYRQWGTPRHS